MKRILLGLVAAAATAALASAAIAADKKTIVFIVNGPSDFWKIMEAAVAHEATYPAHRDEYGPILASVIEAGRALSALDYQKILLRRLAFRGRVTALFETIDLLLTPVQPFPPLTLAMIQTLGEQPDLIAKLQRYTCPFDMTGHPTITLPGGASADGLPIAFQLVAARLDEAMLVRAGAAFQRATSWHRRRPSLISRRPQ